MVAEAKDLAKESKTWDNYVREVNTDENNGGSDCTMISIPLQECVKAIFFPTNFFGTANHLLQDL